MPPNTWMRCCEWRRLDDPRRHLKGVRQVGDGQWAAGGRRLEGRPRGLRDPGFSAARGDGRGDPRDRRRDRCRRPVGAERASRRGARDPAGRAGRAGRRGRTSLTFVILAVVVGAIGLLALGAAVVGILWLLQFVLRNEEKRS